jgi:hypothetical protein
VRSYVRDDSEEGSLLVSSNRVSITFFGGLPWQRPVSSIAYR